MPLVGHMKPALIDRDLINSQRYSPLCQCWCNYFDWFLMFMPLTSDTCRRRLEALEEANRRREERRRKMHAQARCPRSESGQGAGTGCSWLACSFSSPFSVISLCACLANVAAFNWATHCQNEQSHQVRLGRAAIPSLGYSSRVTAQLQCATGRPSLSSRVPFRSRPETAITKAASGSTAPRAATKGACDGA